MEPDSILPPGFRFHPTDEELVTYYLKRRINGVRIDLEIIPEVHVYKCEPWDLPGQSILQSKDLEWYFFSPRDPKFQKGSRTNRATEGGYWKSTGIDKKVNSLSRVVGTKKTLFYYIGRSPHGRRTDWGMHEYRLDDKECDTPSSGLQDVYALCRIFKKSSKIPNIGENDVNSVSDPSSSMEKAFLDTIPTKNMSNIQNSVSDPSSSMKKAFSDTIPTKNMSNIQNSVSGPSSSMEKAFIDTIPTEDMSNIQWGYHYFQGETSNNNFTTTDHDHHDDNLLNDGDFDDLLNSWLGSPES